LANETLCLYMYKNNMQSEQFHLNDLPVPEYVLHARARHVLYNIITFRAISYGQCLDLWNR